jgi:hypothetical protein
VVAIFPIQVHGAEARRGAPTFLVSLRRVAYGLLCAPAIFACSSRPATAEGTTSDDDLATLLRVRREVETLASADGCANSRDCRYAAAGNKACGGPSRYIVYCSATTDQQALSRALADLERAEKAHNEKSGVVSDCRAEEPPEVEAVEGVCRARRGGSQPAPPAAAPEPADPGFVLPDAGVTP